MYCGTSINKVSGPPASIRSTWKKPFFKNDVRKLSRIFRSLLQRRCYLFSHFFPNDLQFTNRFDTKLIRSVTVTFFGLSMRVRCKKLIILPLWRVQSQYLKFIHASTFRVSGTVSNSISQKSSFFGRPFEGFNECAICMENSILSLEFGSEHQYFEEKFWGPSKASEYKIPKEIISDLHCYSLGL